MISYNQLKSIAFHVGLSGYIAGLFLIDVARIVPSISMILLCLLALAELFEKNRKISLKIGKPYLLLAGSFVVVLPSIIYSENLHYFTERVQILLPYLLLPLAFWVLPSINKTQLKNYILFFIACCFLVCGEAFINYVLNQEIVNQLYLESKVMPTLVSHHPTFSMMIVMAIFLCYYLINSQSLVQKKIQFYAVTIAGIFLFIFIHIYSVRSGLLALYILILWELIQFIFIKKQLKKAIISLLILLSIGALTLSLSPTVRNKITNTSQDLAVVKAKGSANNQSLASRLISYKNAIQIANESSILFGCGLGDIEDANNKIFETYYPEVEKKILPHNQYLFYYAAIGLIGLIGFIATFYFPLTVKFLRQNAILSTNYILISSYFLVEAPLENQLGVGFSLLFLLLPMQEVIKRS